MGDETSKAVDVNSPYYLHPASNTTLVISPVVLRDENYGEWARSVYNAFKANNKTGFIDGSIEPPTAPAELAQWVKVNSTLGAWIHNTLDAAIRSTVPLTDNVKDMWDDIKERFSIGNGPRINELKHQIANCEQQGDSVVTYYGRLRKLWEELAAYLTPPCSCTCTCGSKAALTKEREDEKIHQFLIGLDSTLYGNVQSNILMQDPLPSLNSVFSKALTQERKDSLSRTTEKRNEAIGFATPGTSRNRGAMAGRGTDRPRSNSTCSHCGKFGHDQENCFELLGYPDWWYSENRAAARGKGRGSRGGRTGSSRGRGSNVANAATGRPTGSSTTVPPITESDRASIPSMSNEQWQLLFSSMMNSATANSSTAKLDGKSLSTRWLIDSGCSNHMSGNRSMFSTLTDATHSPVGLPNGKQVMATKEGTVILSENLTLSNVLYVPDLKCNLISVSQLLVNSHCNVTFTNKLCVIQDRNSRTLIGAGEQSDEVYWFKPQQPVHAYQTTVLGKHELWHRRLGHPSRKVVSLLPFFSTSDNKAHSSSKDFCECDVCLRAHQTRSVFPLSDSKADDLFSLIHCDIWGDYKVASSCGAYYFLTIADDFSRAVWVYLMTSKSEVGQIIKD
ncbi:hypothetical protein SOVF_190600, partial [Spinacia oleracea]